MQPPTHSMRRRAVRYLASLGAWPLARVAAAAAVGDARAAMPQCVLSPAMTEGPFFLDKALERADLVSGTANPAVRDAVPLELTIRLLDARRACAPVTGWHVDIWHTDALGRYSGVQGQGGEPFCRGYQITDAGGAVVFRTVYPGWYPGRTIHVHVKARRFSGGVGATREFTTQIFFDEALNDAVMALPPYDRRGTRRTRNADDGIFAEATRLIAAATMDSGPARRVRALAVLGLEGGSA